MLNTCPLCGNKLQGGLCDSCAGVMVQTTREKLVDSMRSRNAKVSIVPVDDQRIVIVLPEGLDDPKTIALARDSLAALPRDSARMTIPDLDDIRILREIPEVRSFALRVFQGSMVSFLALTPSPASDIHGRTFWASVLAGCPIVEIKDLSRSINVYQVGRDDRIEEAMALETIYGWIASGLPGVFLESARKVQAKAIGAFISKKIEGAEEER